MKTIKVSFDYNNAHYDINCKVMRDFKHHVYELTAHKCNEKLDFYNNDDVYWSIYDTETNIEVRLNPMITEVTGIVMWLDDSSVLDNFENIETSIQGLL